ncbi:MAG TPA: DNA polymerase III subunit delta' [Dehalococcoidia bacterium]|nr:DNA polymerase III subunit delta' [Dehalococcoidia bacterium]
MWQVLGHPKATTLLERSIQRGRLSHAYLFVGPPHVGKMTLALNLAQAVNCQAEDVPCGECASCRRIASGKHADVQIIGLISTEKKEISIEQMREMQNSASLPPYEGKQKVFIIEKADLLSHEASNSLLKTLEEPLPGILFILLTARERLLLPTIISRCQRVELRPLPFTTVEEVLHQRYGVPEQKADLLARLSEGCLGWALLAIRDERLLEERTQRLNTLIALTGASSRQRLAYATKLAAQFSQAREEMEKVLALWVNWWRDLLLVKGGNGKSITNTDQESALLQQAKKHSLRQIKDFIHHLQAVSEQLEQNANPRLALEVLMLNMP